MKWLGIFLVVLLVPVSAQAVLHWKAEAMPGAWVVIVSDKDDTPGQSTTMRFFIDPHEGGDHLRAKVRLFILKDKPEDAVRKGRCELFVDDTLMDELGDHWIMGKDGRELWFANLRQKDRVSLGIFWDHPSVVDYATMETENSHGTHTRSWETRRIEQHFKKEPELDRASYFREFIA